MKGNIQYLSAKVIKRGNFKKPYRIYGKTKGRSSTGTLCVLLEYSWQEKVRVNNNLMWRMKQGEMSINNF